jgi:hypothetical protein
MLLNVFKLVCSYLVIDMAFIVEGGAYPEKLW